MSAARECVPKTARGWHALVYISHWHIVGYASKIARINGMVQFSSFLGDSVSAEGTTPFCQVMPAFFSV